MTVQCKFFKYQEKYPSGAAWNTDWNLPVVVDDTVSIKISELNSSSDVSALSILASET